MMDIRYKLLTAFLVSVGLIWVSSAATLLSGKSTIKIFHDLTDDVIPGTDTMSAMKFHAAEIEAETVEYIINKKLMSTYEPSTAELYAKHEKILALSRKHIDHEKHLSPENLRAAGELSGLIQNVLNASDHIINLSHEDINNIQVLVGRVGIFHKAHELLGNRLNKHLSVHQEELSSGQVKIEEMNYRNIKTIWILSLGISLLVVTIAWVVDRIFVKHNRERDIIEDLLKNKTVQLQKAVEYAEEMASSANQASRAKSEFLANMSHEIRTPMNAILGFTEILGDKVEDTEHKGYLNTISASGKTLLRLIDDILDLSKLEAGKFSLQYTAMNPLRMFREIERIFSLKIEEKGLEFHSDIASSLPESLILDEIRLRQVLINLVGNAVKFTEKGYIQLSVRSKYPDQDRSRLDLVVSVQDTGIGIHADQQKEIFEAFTQQIGQRAEQFGGTGLGLTISKRIVELMGGKISLETSVGEGSTFFVTLNDIAVGSVSDTAGNKSEFEPDSIIFEKATILIVDDVEANLDLLTSFLRDYGFNLLTAKDGSEAVTIAKKYDLDMILMDMKMPKMDGYEATGILKKDETTQSIPIVSLTASALKKDEELLFDAGCDGYLKKPVSKLDLTKEIMRHLGRCHFFTST
jgi:signal transduction histidine kinase/CheY-like chemotaxis protein